jgi:hypothetical protein
MRQIPPLAMATPLASKPARAPRLNALAKKDLLETERPVKVGIHFCSGFSPFKECLPTE